MATKSTKKTENNRFEQFRTRALTVGVGELATRTVSTQPFTLGNDEGFDPAIELPKPALRARLIAEDSLRSGDVLTVSKIIFGPYVDRIMEQLEYYERETGESAEIVLVGIIHAYFTHFYGEGAADAVFPSVSN